MKNRGDQQILFEIVQTLFQPYILDFHVCSLVSLNYCSHFPFYFCTVLQLQLDEKYLNFCRYEEKLFYEKIVCCGGPLSVFTSTMYIELGVPQIPLTCQWPVSSVEKKWRQLKQFQCDKKLASFTRYRCSAITNSSIQSD